MSKWNDFCESVSKTTKKTADKTKTLANLASLKLKLSKLEVKVSEEYDSLGRIYYLQEVGKVDNREAIAMQLKFISDINKQINAVKGEIREIKRAEAEAKAAKAAEEAENGGDSEAAGEEVGASSASEE